MTECNFCAEIPRIFGNDKPILEATLDTGSGSTYDYGIYLYKDGDETALSFQDADYGETALMVINYCPMCGRKLAEDK